MAWLRAVSLAALLVMPGCASRDERATQAIADATIAFNGGDYQRAKELSLKAIRDRDDIVDYWLLLGRAELAVQNYGGAYVAYHRAVELDRSSVEVIQMLAQLSLMTTDLEQASNYADQLLLISPGHPAALLTQGVIALRQKRYDEALEKAEQVLARYPTEESALLLKARVLFAQEDRSSAIELVERSVQVGGASRGKFEELLTFYRKAGDRAGLAATHRRLIAIEPDNVALKLAYAKDALADNNVGLAVAVLRDGLRSKRLASSELRQIALVLSSAPRGTLGEQQIRSLGSDVPLTARVALASVALEHGYYGLAEEWTESFSRKEVTPANAPAIALYAASQLHLDRPDEARRQADRVLKTDKSNPRALQVRALHALRTNDFDLAIHDAQILVRDHPMLDSHRLLLADAFKGKGEGALEGLTLRRSRHDLPESRAIASRYADYLKRQRA